MAGPDPKRPVVPSKDKRQVSEYSSPLVQLLTDNTSAKGAVDNYDQGGFDLTTDIFGEIRINIFNISKINSEVRGGKRHFISPVIGFAVSDI